MTFDHTKDTVKVFEGDLPHLEQRDEDGNVQWFTNGEYDNILKKWIPEPKLIDQEALFKKMQSEVENEAGKKESPPHKEKETAKNEMGKYPF